MRVAWRAAIGMQIAAALVLGGCGGNPGPLGELKPGELKGKDQAVVVMAAEMAGRTVAFACHTVEFRRDGGGGGTRQIANAKYSLPGAPGVLQLQAGHYAIVGVYCGIKPEVRIMAPPGMTYATFTLAPGEFVDIGRIVIVQHQDAETFSIRGATKFVPFILPLEPAKLADLREDVRAALVTRRMTAGFTVATAERERMCAQQRRQKQNALLASNREPIVCGLS